MSFFNELKRRNVIRVAIAYIVMAWLVMQVTDVILNNIEAPGWVFQTILLLLGIGFLVAMFFSWAFELTPEGLKREHEVERSQSITPQTGKKLNTAIVVLMALAIAYLLFDKISGTRPAAVSAPAVEVAGDSTGPKATAAPDTEPTISRQSIAVLPFDNRSPDPADAYFTDGIHDDLLTNLSRISALKVISRTSVTQFKDTEKTIPQIAEELGVAHIMEGAVQRSGNQVRINVQLIDAKTDEHLWAEIYDRELTAENLFAIQSEISEVIAGQLQATLSPQETERINQMPTEDLVAYEAYLKGRQLMVNRNSTELEQAIREFEKAVELDPGFALAWVGLADSYLLLLSYGTVSREEARTMIRDALERAMAIDDQLGEAHASMGLFHQDANNWQEAEQSFLKAIELNPNYATAYHWYSGWLDRNPLRVDEVIANAARAVELDPSSPVMRAQLAAAYQSKGLYSIAEQHAKRVMELDPESMVGPYRVFNLYLFAMGRFVDSIPFIEKAISLDPGNLWMQAYLVLAYANLGEFEKAIAVRERMADIDPDFESVVYADVTINALSLNAAASREVINHTLPRKTDDEYASAFYGFIEYALGDLERGTEIMFTAEPGWLNEDEWPRLISRFTAYSCIAAQFLISSDQPDMGRALLQQATTYLTVELPKVNEHADDFLPQLCHAAAGDREKTLSAMETALSHNHLNFWRVFHRPAMFDFVRDDPRFVAVMQEYERRIAVQREQLEAMSREPGP